MKKAKCFLCGNDASSIPTTGDFCDIDCPVCGHVYSSYSFITSFLSDETGLLTIYDANNKPLSSEENEKAKIALRYYFKSHSMNRTNAKTITSDNWKDIVESMSYPNLLEKIELVLDYFSDKTKFLYQYVEINIFTDYPIFFSLNEEELRGILNYLLEEGYLVQFSNKKEWVSSACLTPKGIKYQQEKQKSRIKSKQCFVAMWFNDDISDGKPNMQKVYTDYIKPAIEATDLKFAARKIDEVHHVNDINDQIIAEIRRSRFMVVDLTGYRGGVYFEAGFGFGLGMPVIYTCHKDWLNDVHFDVSHRNMLLWTDKQNDPDYEKLNLEAFKNNLIARINAVVV